ncbi:TraB/GumN family protein [Litoribacillus peritrichatus]|uniref:TraB/GumN family protein n=1 Tax=Litoribacillus peritrichatus TaxID=718191 RepID=A0ABP7N593_9GAMM
MALVKQWVLFLLIFVSMVTPSFADSPVWKVSKGDHHLFVGGTIHLLSKSDYPLPPAFEQAYKQASLLVFETDLEALTDPEFQKYMMNAVTYQNGTSLKEVLSAETYEAMANYLSERGVPMDRLPNFKAGMMSVTMSLVELQRLGMTGTGVDEFYNLKALQDEKGIGELETVETQVDFIANMGEGQEDELIRYTLEDLKNLNELMKDLKHAWRHGDLAKMEKDMMLPLKKDFPDVYHQMLVERNNAWLPQLENMMKDKRVEFVLVGALHLVGEDGVIHQLKKRGYKVEIVK